MLLDNISLFTKIVERGSLAGAARDTGLSPTTVSERLSALEAHFGTVLLNRTTRAISVTNEGRILLEAAKSVLNEVDHLEAAVRQGAHTLSGPIRVSAPSDLGRSEISSAIDSFQAAHSAISIDLILSDGYLDVVGEAIDIAIRFGEITDSSLRARALGQFHRVVCASPSYIERFGAPQTPADLAMHNCLVMRFGGYLDNLWQFGQGDTAHRIQVSGRRIANDGALVRRWACQGQGIVLKSELDVAADITAGRLVLLLTDYAVPKTPLQLLLPPSRSQPLRVHAFVDHLAAHFRKIADGK